MKKITLLFYLIFLCHFSLFAQQEISTFKDNAIKSAEAYLDSLVDLKIFKQYFELEEDASTAILNLPFEQLGKSTLKTQDILGFVLSYKFKESKMILEKHTSLRFRLHVNNKMEVDYSKVWNSRDWAAVVGNIQVRFDTSPKEYKERYIRSVFDYALKLENKEVQAPEKVQAFLKKEYPDQEWGPIEISSWSFPPYYVTYQVTQSNCNPCLQLSLSVDKLIVLNTEKVQMFSIEN